MTLKESNCPHCDESIEVESDQYGMEGRCPQCEKKFIIGDATATNDEEASNETPIDDADTKKEQPPSDNEEADIPPPIPDKFISGSLTPLTSNSNDSASRNSPELTFLAKGKTQAQELIADFRTINFKAEVIPLESSNLQKVIKDFVFWAVTLLGTVPLLIVTVASTQMQLTMFALFFAFVWGVIFKYFVLKDFGGWKWPLASMFFTGIVGMVLLGLFYKHVLPENFLSMWASDNPITSLVGNVICIGISEEALKSVPVALYVILKRKSLVPEDIVIIGVFSGLGFAAFENLDYGNDSVFSSLVLTVTHGAEGLQDGVQTAMVTAMLRSVSLVFCHAVWSGIVGYFIAIAFYRKKKITALIILGLCVSSVLHGVYNWFTGIQPTISAVVAGFSFMLFYGYISKLRQTTESVEG